MWTIITVIIIVFLIIIFYVMTQLRKVVPTNEAHVVQTAKKSISYGKNVDGGKNGNAYYAWPSWLPSWGVSVQKLPLSIFDLQLNDYKAYDSGKVPFQVDITAFFEIKEPETAAEKVDTISDLRKQLNETLKWVVRQVLASKDILDIMESRSEIKDEFYNQVFSAVKSWGIKLQNVEFMDIRDADGSKVVTNIMMKKRSQIESESEIEVAENQKKAIIEKENKEAEARSSAASAKSKADIIASDAQREAELKVIENEKITQNKEIEKERVLAIQKEEAKQKLYEAEKVTTEKELEVTKVQEEKTAEIAKSIEIIKANEQKEKIIIDATAGKEKVELEAQANKVKVELQASADKNRIESIGIAKAKELDYIGTAEAKNKTQMAEALNTFDKEALDYMKKELDVNLSEIVDLEKAKALSKADIKVISTWKNGGEWVKSFMDLFSANWGSNIWAMVEAAKNTMWEEKVNELIGKFTGKKEVTNKIAKVVKK